MTAVAITHRNDRPKLQNIDEFIYLGFSCKIGRDPETRDWPMYRDGEVIGYARTKDEGCTTLRASCEETARHTRIVTADIAAERAAAQEGVAPTAPARTVDELRGELDIVTDEIQTRKHDGRNYDNLRVMRDKIIAELDAAHAAKKSAAPCADGQANCSASGLGTCHKSLCNTLASHAYELFDEPIVLCCKHYSEDIIGEPCGHKCPSCNDPSTGLCPACRENGEASAATDLEPVDDIYAPPFGLPEPAPTEEELDDETITPGACYGYGGDCQNPATQRLTINIALNNQASILPDQVAVCDTCAPKWQFLVIPDGTCYACKGQHPIQQCPEVRAVLAAEDDRDRASRDILDAEHAADLTNLDRVLTPDDPCADVRRELTEARAVLRQIADVAGNLSDEVIQRIGGINDAHALALKVVYARQIARAALKD